MKALSLSSKFHHRSSRTIFLLLIVSLALFLPVSSIHSAVASDSNHRIVIPMVLSEHWTGQPVQLGIYADQWIGDQNTINQEFHALDAWSGKKMSLAGVFSDIELPAYEPHVKNTFTLLWNNGYTPFVNLGSKRSATSIANGEYDANLRAWAKSFIEYAQGGARMAFIAPLQEMNGYWVPYYQGPQAFKSAYDHIRAIFASEGVPPQSVRWVFAPNGYTKIGDEFELYYPGADKVDDVAFSSYNFGYCPYANKVWSTPKQTFHKIMIRMHAMAPGKPIYVAQTGTTAMTSTGWNDAAKNKWLVDAYTLLANDGASGILYFNLDQDTGNGICDLAMYKTWGSNQRNYAGYAEAIKPSRFTYVSPIDTLRANLSAHNLLPNP